MTLVLMDKLAPVSLFLHRHSIRFSIRRSQTLKLGMLLNKNSSLLESKPSCSLQPRFVPGVFQLLYQLPSR